MATTTPEHFGTLSHGRERRFVRALMAESTSEALAGAGRWSWQLLDWPEWPPRT